MNRKHARKLRLGRETLRRLNGNSLNTVWGGKKKPPRDTLTDDTMLDTNCPGCTEPNPDPPDGPKIPGTVGPGSMRVSCDPCTV